MQIFRSSIDTRLLLTHLTNLYWSSVPGAVLDAEDTVRYKDTDTEDTRQI